IKTRSCSRRLAFCQTPVKTLAPATDALQCVHKRLKNLADIVGRLYQTPVSVGVWHRRPTIGINSVWSLLYGPATANSRNASVGLQSDLFSHGLYCPPSQCACKRCCLARSLPNTETPGSMEYLLCLADAGPHPLAYRAARARIERCCFFKMAETMV